MISDSSVLLILAIFIPFIGAAVVNFLGSYKNLRDAASIICGIVLIYFIYLIYGKLATHEVVSATLFSPLAGMPIAFKVEPLGIIYAGVASCLWVVTTLYSVGYLRHIKDANQTRFFIFMAVSIGCSIGLAFAGNLLTMLIFYEALTLATYPLVAHKGDAVAIKGARKYLAYLLGSSIIFFIPAIIITFSIAGSLDFVRGGIINASPALIIMLLLMFAYGIGKAALMPLHGWLPAAMVAPTPVSALLHAVAVVKAGVFCIIKIIVYIFGVFTLHKTSGAEVLSYLAAGTIIAASTIAIFKDNLKERLAYSTIAQLSYIILAAAIFTLPGVAAASTHIVSHAVAKITLFFTAGAIIIVSGRKYVSELNGMGRRMPFIFICFFLASLSIIGVPGFAGAESKHLIITAAEQAGMGWIIYVLYASMALNAAYFLPVTYRAFAKKPNEREIPATPITIKLAVLITTFLTLAFSSYSHYITDIMGNI